MDGGEWNAAHIVGNISTNKNQEDRIIGVKCIGIEEYMYQAEAERLSRISDEYRGEENKIINVNFYILKYLTLVVHTFNPNTWKAEAGGSLRSRPAWSTE